MSQRQIFFIFTLIFLLCCNFSKSQDSTYTQSVQFNSGSYKLNKQQTQKLSTIVDSISKHPYLTIELQGNTDNLGSFEINRKISQLRARNIKKILTTHGIAENIITIKALGKSNPIATNATAIGRQQNRRVDIVVTKPIIALVQEKKPIQNIADLLTQLSVPLQTFCINPYNDTAIRCKQGTVVYIKANTLLPQSNCNNKCITLKIKEVFSKSDMLFENLTTTSNGSMIETQGMIYTEALDCNGTVLEFQKNKQLVIIVPTDTIVPTAKIFDGNRLHNDVMNWTVSNNSILSNFTLQELDICSGWLCGGVKHEIDCKICSFWFCRVKRVGKTIKGLFSKAQREKNIEFNRCQEQLKFLNNINTIILSSQPLVIEQRPPLAPELIPQCNKLEELLKKYNVSNVEALTMAINKPLLDSFKISSIDALKDTLSKLSIENIELAYQNKNLSFEDFKYYVYNTSKLGWSNIDNFADIPKHKKNYTYHQSYSRKKY